MYVKGLYDVFSFQNIHSFHINNHYPTSIYATSIFFFSNVLMLKTRSQKTFFHKSLLISLHLRYSQFFLYSHLLAIHLVSTLSHISLSQSIPFLYFLFYRSTPIYLIKFFHTLLSIHTLTL